MTVDAWRHLEQTDCGHSGGNSTWQPEQILRFFIGE
jgi:hypothetical protein